LIVGPGAGDGGGVSFSDEESSPESCADPGYTSSNPGECRPFETPEPPSETPEEPPETEPAVIAYDSDGYTVNEFIGSDVKDSRLVGTRRDEVGLDGGENAIWKKGPFGRINQRVIDPISTFIFGQDEEKANCKYKKVNGPIKPKCADKLEELEQNGGTSNYHSPSTTGSFSKYGLTGGKRIRGNDPRKIEKGRMVNATVVIQPEKDGLIDEISDKARSGVELATSWGQGSSNDGLESSSSQGRGEDSEDKITSEGSHISESSTISSGDDYIVSSTSALTRNYGEYSDSTDDDSDSVDDHSLLPSKLGAGIAR
jgi:hypothetical protein